MAMVGRKRAVAASAQACLLAQVYDLLARCASECKADLDMQGNITPSMSWSSSW